MADKNQKNGKKEKDDKEDISDEEEELKIKKDHEVPKHYHVTYEKRESEDHPPAEIDKIFSRTTLQIIGPRTSQSALSLQLSEIMRRTSFSFLYPGTDGEAYDYASERKNAQAPIIPSIMHLIKGSLGCGFLCVHEGWKFCGVWTALIVAVVIAILVRYSYRMIGNSAQRTYELIRVPKLSYPQLAEAALALGPLRCSKKSCRRARHAMNVWIFLKIMGSLCIYEIIMAKTLKNSLEYLAPKTIVGLRIYVIILVIPLIVLSMIRNLRLLVIMATVADFYIVLCVAVAMYQTIVGPERLGTLPAWRSMYGLFKFSAIYSYAIDGSHTILPIENHMKKPRYFYIVSDIGLLSTALFLICIGFVGYWGWGEKSESPFTIHMTNNLAFVVMQFILAIFFAVTFTIQLFIPFEILWHYATKKFKWFKSNPRSARGVLTLQIVLISCAAIAWPHIIDVICFIGVLCSAWLLFIVPAVIDSFIYWDERKQSKMRMTMHIVNIFYVLFGLCLFFGGIASIINSFLTKGIS